MRVAHLIPTNSLGGHVNQLRVLLEHAEQQDIEHQLVFWSRENSIDAVVANQFNSELTYVRKGGMIGGLRNLRKAISNVSPDVIHMWHPYAFNWEHIGMLHRLANRLVCSIGNPADRWIRYPTQAFRFYVKRSHHVFFSSNSQLEFARQFLRVNNSSVAYPSEIIADTGNTQNIKGALGIPAESHVVAAVGRLIPGKRLKDLIWSMEILKTIRDDVHLVIFGGGPQTQLLQEYARDLDLTTRVHFHDWTTCVVEILRNCLCVISCSDSHGVPSCAVTAAVANIPFISAGSKGVMELFVNNRNSLLFGPGDTGSLARCINNLMNDASVSQRLIQQTRTLEADAFSPLQFAAKYAEVFQSVANA